MTDSILPKYLSKTLDDGQDASEETTHDAGCFGYLRGIRDRAIMLELKKNDGSIQAIAYAYIDRIDYDPADGITLHTGGQKIRIQGHSLNTKSATTPSLFETLTRQRVVWIQITERPFFGLNRSPAVSTIA